MIRRGEEPSWLPRYLPANAGRVLWEAASEPAQWERCFTPSDRLACVERMLRENSSADDLLLFVYGAPEESVRLRQADALPHLQMLCAPLSTIWITSPSQAWLIELQDYDVRLAVPPKPTPEEAAVVELRRKAILAPITEALEAGGIEYAVYLEAERPARIASEPFRRGDPIDWRGLTKTFQAAVPRHDHNALVRELEALLTMKHSTQEVLAIRLLHPEAPVLTMPAREFLRFIRPVMLAADRPLDQDVPGGTLDVIGLRFHPAGAQWLAQITAKHLNWYLKAVG